ncbi:class I SAM-dependent methyltransferase [Saccharothrix violaceirubra]|uniref:SAM-dependent methyltransferase n=1 Tax=Saccharothrix violaceirubra TaxID=413306 RepID=A0A7W7WVV7_9PSEU|nr:class I SAM-dependent methyltransferase [Saccharothrix violaceirubra]MBB4965749.1 SAM-dependent methyltransferase [Saccharothrix violaceirubra]
MSRFLDTGEVPSPDCAAVATVSCTTLYRDDAAFAAYAVSRQTSTTTDDGARRESLCRGELDLAGRGDLGRVIDLMCGVGGHLAAVKGSDLGWTSYTGIDVNPVAVEAARQAHGGDDRVDFVEADIATWRPEPGTADTVLLMYEALNALGPTRTVALLEVIAGVLAPGGVALVDVAPPADRGAAREAVLLPDPQTAVLSGVDDAGSDATQRLSAHTVHFVGADGCRLHFSHLWWEPTADLLRALFHRAGLDIRSEHRVHGDVVSDKPSTAQSIQFVLTRAGDR